MVMGGIVAIEKSLTAWFLKLLGLFLSSNLLTLPYLPGGE